MDGGHDPADEVESIRETLAILSDPVAAEQIRESELALASGEPATSLADVKAQLARRRRGVASRRE